jgi:hypothetical protein
MLRSAYRTIHRFDDTTRTVAVVDVDRAAARVPHTETSVIIGGPPGTG